MWKKSYDDGAILYLVPTPIGNMEDITFRCLKVLKEVGVVFSEDTRITQNLFNYFDIKNKLVALHDHNENIVKEEVLSYLEKGCNVAIVTDRGTPIISDPGYKVVEYVTKKGYNVISLPGPTAFVPALTLSTLSPQPFLFYGFLNAKDTKQKRELDNLKNYPFTIIFYESPKRLEETLKNMLEIFGNRKIAIVRELSKKYEETIRGNIKEILVNYKELKGEIVLVVEGVKQNFQDLSINQHVDLYIQDNLSLNDAMKKVAKERGIPKSIVYKEYHQNK